LGRKDVNIIIIKLIINLIHDITIFQFKTVVQDRKYIRRAVW